MKFGLVYKIRILRSFRSKNRS